MSSRRGHRYRLCQRSAQCDNRNCGSIPITYKHGLPKENPEILKENSEIPEKMRRKMQQRSKTLRNREPGAEVEWIRFLEEQRAIEQRAPSEATQRRVLAGSS